MRFHLKPILLALAINGQYVPSVNAAIEFTHLQQALSSDRLETAQINRVYQASVASADGVAGLQQHLTQVEATNGDPKKRAKASLLSAAIAWRQGNTQQALLEVKKSLAFNASIDGYAWLARLQEATGDVTAAKSSYQRQLALTDSAQEQQHIRLRLALLNNDRDSFIAYAKQYPQQQLQIAEVLALLGHSNTAVEVANTITPTAQSLLLQADWSLSAKQPLQAADYAWQAFNAAEQSSDKRYALALYVEAWRAQGKLDNAAAFLKQHANDEITQSLYVDLLLELGRYDDALSIVQHSNEPALKAREAALLELANRPEALTQYYQQQIVANPHDINAYNGLAAELINQGKQQAAKDVYAKWAQHNADNLPRLFDAAQRMIEMGLTDDAISMIQRYAKSDKANIKIKLFLFETYLNAGDDESAATVLQQLDKQLAPGSATRISLAENYERLHLPKIALQQLRKVEDNGGRLGYDQQLHMASLAEQVGQHPLAFSIWQQLWQQAVLPARKNFLENLIINSSRTLGTFTQLVNELQQRLAQKTATQNDVNLLVGLYLADDKQSQAVATVEQFARYKHLNNINRLKQLASIYGRVQAYDKLNDVWQQLAQLEPKNAQQYWQQITLNSLRNNIFDAEKPRKGQTPQQLRLQQVQSLLSKLQQNGAQIDHEFTAGLYAMAGLQQQAIDEYQSAFAANPNNNDSLLQMVQLLNKQQQSTTATGMLQFQLEFADDANRYSAATDGLLNLFAGGEQGLSDSELVQSQQVLNWLKRRLIERLVFDADQSRTLLTLSDLAQTQGEFATAEEANRLVLAINTVQRPAVLRSMISQFSGASADGSSSGPVIGDAQKKLRYGRRLLALQQEFPPALYSDLAQALLADGDILGAERAFSMMTDIPGIVNVRQQKGDAYAKAGYDDRALTYYRQALVTDQSNYDLLLKTSILEQQNNHHSIAYRWYWLGLQHLVEQQPLYQANEELSRVSDFSKFYPSLSEGMLISMLSKPEFAKQTAKDLTQLFDDILQKSQPRIQEHASFDSLARLKLVVELLRRVASATDNLMLAVNVDKTLASLFDGDAGYQAQKEDYWRHQSGLDKDAAWVRGQPHSWSMNSLLLQAQLQDNFPLQFRLALYQQDWQKVASLVVSVVNAMNVSAPSQRDMMLKNQYYSVMEISAEQVPASIFREQIWPELMKAPQPQLVCFQLQRFNPALYTTIQQTINKPLLTEHSFVQLVLQHSNDFAPPGMRYIGEQSAFDKLVMDKLSVDELIELYEKLQLEFKQNNRRTSLLDGVLLHLLNHQLSDAQQQKLQRIIVKSVTFSSNEKPPAVAIVQQLMLLDVAPSNQSLVIDIAKSVVQMRPETERVVTFLTQFFAGEKQAAYMSLIRLHQDVAAGLGFNFAAGIVQHFFAEQRQHYIDEMLASNKLTDDQIKLFYQEVVSTEADDNQLAQALVHLRQLRPNDPLFFAIWIKLQWRQQHLDVLANDLTKWLEQFPDSDNQHLLYFVRQLSGAASNDNRGEITEMATLVDWLNKSMNPNASRAGLASLYSEVFTKFAEQHAGLALVKQLKQREAEGQSTAPRELHVAGLESLAALFHQDSDKAVALMGTIWRNCISGARQFNGETFTREQLLYDRFDLQGKMLDNRPATEPQQLIAQYIDQDLLDAMAANPNATTLFQQWLAALTDDQRLHEQRLYQLLISGWAQQQTLMQHLDGLLASLDDGRMTLSQLQLLLTGLQYSGEPLQAKQVTQLIQLSQRMPLQSKHTRLLLAQVLANAKQFDTAANVLQALAWQLKFPAMTLDERAVSGRISAIKLDDVVASLAQWKDKQAAMEQLQLLLQLYEVKSGEDKDKLALWYSFVLKAYVDIAAIKSDSTTPMLQRALQAANADDKSAILQLAAARYYMAIGHDKQAASLFDKAMQHPSIQGNWIPYNPAVDEISTRLFGNAAGRDSNDHLLPWISDVMQQADDATLLQMMKTFTDADLSFYNPESLLDVGLVLAKRLGRSGAATQIDALLQRIAEIAPAQSQQFIRQAQQRWIVH